VAHPGRPPCLVPGTVSLEFGAFAGSDQCPAPPVHHARLAGHVPQEAEDRPGVHAHHPSTLLGMALSLSKGHRAAQVVIPRRGRRTRGATCHDAGRLRILAGRATRTRSFCPRAQDWREQMLLHDATHGRASGATCRTSVREPKPVKRSARGLLYTLAIVRSPPARPGRVRGRPVAMRAALIAWSPIAGWCGGG
jgi:hypothetical protein